MAGHSRSKNGVLKNTYVSAIHVFFAVCANDCGDGVQWPKERKPMCFM